MNAEFCDTNVFVYAYDVNAGLKRDLANELLRRLWESGDGTLSVQVLQELYVSLTKKLSRPQPAEDARAIVSDLSTWKVVQVGHSDVVAAIDRAMRWRISFWDAMILTAAIHAGAAIVWTEDLSDGQEYDGVVVCNPFSTLA